MDELAFSTYFLLFVVAFIVWCAFCAVLLVLMRAVSAAARAAGRGVHAGWEWAAAVLIAAGPLDADPDTYAARAAALPHHPHRTTTTPGGTR